MELLAYKVSAGVSIPEAIRLCPHDVALGFTERCDYKITKPAPGDRLWIDDEELQSSQDEGYWAWQPQFYSGRVRAELGLADRDTVIPYYLDVGTDDKKLGASIFKSYIEYVANRFPMLLLGAEPATHALSGRADEPSVWLRYVRIVMYAVILERAIRAVAARPILRARYTRRLVKPHQAHHIDVYGLLQLARQPSLLEVSRTTESGTKGVGETIDVPHVEGTCDNPANQLLLNQLKRLVRATDELLDEMDQQVNAGDAETSLGARIPRRQQKLRSIRRQMTSMLRMEFLQNVSCVMPSSDGLVAVAAHPEYAHAYATVERMLRTGICQEGGDEWHYLGPTWRIYESWCFCVLYTALERCAPDVQWKSHTSRVGSSQVVTGNLGGAVINLYYQLPCPNRKGLEERYFSISQARVPDIVLDCEKDGERRFVIFDAKYRVTRSNLLDAMGSAHIYKDSIKYGEKGPVGAYLLVPHANDVEELTSEGYQRKYRVGCLPLENEVQADAIVQRALVELGCSLDGDR